MRVFKVLPIIVVGLTGCTEEKLDNVTITKLMPTVVSNVESLDFGPIVVLYDSDEEILLMNAGRAPLDISSISVEGNVDGIYTVTPEVEELAPDESISLNINFEPDTFLPYNRDLIVLSNDEENPEFRIPLLGEGIDGPVPDIHVSPQVIDFGLINQGATATEFFELLNVGTGTLEITGVEIDGSSEFSIVNPFAGTHYDQNQSTTVVATYSPTEEGGSNATMTITTNDPDEEIVTVTLLGNGGGDFEYPVAAFNCPNGQVDPPTTLTFDASSSSAPNGNTPLLYQWELLERPPGSSTGFDDADSVTTPFFVDVAGDYSISLTVINSVGLASEPQICNFNALPDESLHIELSWNTGDSDFDVHLVQLQNGDYPLFSLDHDCCWCNPNPHWGQNGTADDPELSLDNRVGYGPEAIHIENPDTGTYGIKVHYFDDKGGGISTATLRVYLDGILIAEEAQVMSQRDLWFVGEVFWVNGVGSFYPVNESPATTTQSVCQ